MGLNDCRDDMSARARRCRRTHTAQRPGFQGRARRGSGSSCQFSRVCVLLCWSNLVMDKRAVVVLKGSFGRVMKTVFHSPRAPSVASRLCRLGLSTHAVRRCTQARPRGEIARCSLHLTPADAVQKCQSTCNSHTHIRLVHLSRHGVASQRADAPTQAISSPRPRSPARRCGRPRSSARDRRRARCSSSAFRSVRCS